MNDPEITRRRLLELGLAAPLGAVVAGCSAFDDADEAAGTLPATPACEDGDGQTPAQTEGPFFTPDSPLRRSLVAPGTSGTRLTLSGRVLTTSCAPVRGALLDFWQADAGGVYDNEGFGFRGHQFTDAGGRYKLETVVPGLYTGRTRHIHVKAQAPRGSLLTTQLYFPGEPRNEDDGLFDPALLVALASQGEARFDFVLELG